MDNWSALIEMKLYNNAVHKPVIGIAGIKALDACMHMVV